MVLAIDATNINRGGGLTHLLNLHYYFIQSRLISKIILFAPQRTLDQVTDSNKLIKVHKEIFEKNILLRFIWAKYKLKEILVDFDVDVLFVPGGTFITDFKPIVTMSRNMLPIDLREASRYGFSFNFFRLCILRLFQRYSFVNSTGFIFLTEYSKECFKNLNWLKSNDFNDQKSIVISHGIDIRFNHLIKQENLNKTFDKSNPFKIIYVSIFDVYKHQINVLKAFAQLLDEGLFLEIHFVGPYYHPEKKRFDYEYKKLSAICKANVFLYGSLNITEQIKLYSKMDCVLFASTCENLPNILIEGMRTGLPILCSNKRPMIDILGDAGVYFDPENVDSIKFSIAEYYSDFNKRLKNSSESYQASLNYSWEKCANETLNYLLQFSK